MFRLVALWLAAQPVIRKKTSLRIAIQSAIRFFSQHCRSRPARRGFSCVERESRQCAFLRGRRLSSERFRSVNVKRATEGRNGTCPLGRCFVHAKIKRESMHAPVFLCGLIVGREKFGCRRCSSGYERTAVLHKGCLSFAGSIR